MKNLIAFTGYAGCGKSTAAQALTSKRQASRISFADPLRNMLRAMGLSWKQLTVEKQEPIGWLDGKSTRQLMQTLGTEWGRQLVHPDIWIRLARRRIQQHREVSSHPLVIDDCRFDNEARMVRELGGIVVRVTREGAANIAPAHVSEAGVSDSLIDRVIFNSTADRDEFQRQVLATLDAA
jgi:Tfp pilus assembly ATPase PilU